MRPSFAAKLITFHRWKNYMRGLPMGGNGIALAPISSGYMSTGSTGRLGREEAAPMPEGAVGLRPVNRRGAIFPVYGETWPQGCSDPEGSTPPSSPVGAPNLGEGLMQ